MKSPAISMRKDLFMGTLNETIERLREIRALELKNFKSLKRWMN